MIHFAAFPPGETFKAEELFRDTGAVRVTQRSVQQPAAA